MQRIILLTRYALRVAWYQLWGKTDELYEVIYEAVEALGGVYVKLLQFLSLRADLFPDKAKLRFLTFYDQVPVEPIDVLGHLSPYQRDQFASVETEPFASGTFGQVYKAKLTDGTVVIIKVKRPDLKKKLFADFLIIKLLGRIIDLLYYQSFVNIPRLINEFKELTYKELDYQQEVSNALFLYEQYRDHPVLVIPYTYANLSDNQIIVQEYIGGVAVTELLRMKAAGHDHEAYLREQLGTDFEQLAGRFSYDCLWQIFSLDKFYSDPHPGNIKILPDNKYAFIDFGIMADSPRNKRDYFQVVKFIAEGAQGIDGSQMGQQMLSIGAHYLHKSMQVYDRTIGEPEQSLEKQALNRYGELINSWKEQLHQLQTGKTDNYSRVWIDLFTLGEQFEMQMPKGLFAGLRTSALITHFVQYLAPANYDTRKMLLQLVNDIDETQLVNVEDTEAQKIGIEQALETLSNWLENLAETDLMLYQDIHRTSV